MHITPPTKVTKENFKKYEEKKNVTTPTTACCAQGIKARDRIVYENFVIIFFFILFYFIILSNEFREKCGKLMRKVRPRTWARKSYF